MPQYIVSLKAPATVEGAVIVEADNSEEAKKKALERAHSVVWSKSSVDEQRAEAGRVVLVAP